MAISGAPGCDPLADLDLALGDDAVDRRADHRAREIEPRLVERGAWRRRPRGWCRPGRRRSAPGWRCVSPTAAARGGLACAMRRLGQRESPARPSIGVAALVSSSPETAPERERLTALEVDLGLVEGRPARAASCARAWPMSASRAVTCGGQRAAGGGGLPAPCASRLRARPRALPTAILASVSSRRTSRSPLRDRLGFTTGTWATGAARPAASPAPTSAPT